MNDDPISRRDAKELIKKERLDCIDVGAIGAANTCGALIEALDKLPALDADGRDETREILADRELMASLRLGIQQLREGRSIFWDELKRELELSNAGESKERSQYISGRSWRSKPMECFGGFASAVEKAAWDAASDETLAQIDVSAPPAAERRPAVERPDRPTMLLARRFTGIGGIWVWLTRKEADWACQWHGSDDCDYKSRDLLEVDRNASDSAALALYDVDISTSGDAAQPGE